MLSRIQFSAQPVDDAHTWHTASDEHGNELGRALVTHRSGTRLVNSLQVRPEHRQHGVGRQLMGAVIEAHGDHEMTLEPSPFGDGGPTERRLRSFYGSMGFTKSGRSLMVRRPS
jgi:GNAT superfamily N-acetyltransferase